MDWIMNAINAYGLLAVFTLILLEYACFPLPSEVVSLFRGDCFTEQLDISGNLGTQRACGCAWRTHLLSDRLLRRISISGKT